MDRKQTAYKKYTEAIKANKVTNYILVGLLIGELGLGTHCLAKASNKMEEIKKTPAYSATLNGELDNALESCKNNECSYQEYFDKVESLKYNKDIAKQAEPEKYEEYSASMKGFATAFGVAAATAAAGTLTRIRTDKLEEKAQEEYLAELDME